MSRTLKNFLTFFLVLVLTVVTVTALSLATQAKTETAAAEYTERLETVQKEETAKLTAVVPEKESLNFWACAGCFLLLLYIPAGGGILYIRARRKGRQQQDPEYKGFRPFIFYLRERCRFISVTFLCFMNADAVFSESAISFRVLEDCMCQRKILHFSEKSWLPGEQLSGIQEKILEND